MSDRRAPDAAEDPVERRWQVAVAVLAIAVIAAAIRLSGSILGGDDGPYEAIPSSEKAHSVIDALAVDRGQPLAITGYVFDGSARGLRLCTTREPGDPPRCVAPYLSLEGVDAGFVVLRNGTDAEGLPMAWHDDPVTLVGVLNGTVLAVTDVLAD